MHIPQEIGSKIAVKPCHRSLFEVLGFWAVYVTPESVEMRRDFPDGALWGCPPGLSAWVASLPE